MQLWIKRSVYSIPFIESTIQAFKKCVIYRKGLCQAIEECVGMEVKGDFMPFPKVTETAI